VASPISRLNWAALRLHGGTQERIAGHGSSIAGNDGANRTSPAEHPSSEQLPTMSQHLGLSRGLFDPCDSQRCRSSGSLPRCRALPCCDLYRSVLAERNLLKVASVAAGVSGSQFTSKV
jgi:hypothetical protein